MGGNSPSGGQIIPFNVSALAPFMPSVFNGPYNAQGALQNEEMLAQKFPWITPPAGQFEGAQPGQATGTGGGGGLPSLPGLSPPIPPTVPQGGNSGAQFNPAAAAVSATNPMTPAPLQQILSVLMAGNPTGGQ